MTGVAWYYWFGFYLDVRNLNRETNIIFKKSMWCGNVDKGRLLVGGCREIVLMGTLHPEVLFKLMLRCILFH